MWISNLSVMIYLVLQAPNMNALEMLNTNTFKNINKISLPSENDHPSLDLDLSLAQPGKKPVPKNNVRKYGKEEWKNPADNGIKKVGGNRIEGTILNNSQHYQLETGMGILQGYESGIQNTDSQISNHHKVGLTSDYSDHTSRKKIKVSGFQGSPHISPHTTWIKDREIKQPLNISLYHHQNKDADKMVATLYKGRQILEQQSPTFPVQKIHKNLILKSIDHDQTVGAEEEKKKHIDIKDLDNQQGEGEKEFPNKMMMKEGDIGIGKPQRALEICTRNMMEQMGLLKGVQKSFYTLKVCMSRNFNSKGIQTDKPFETELAERIRKAPIALILKFLGIIVLLDDEEGLMNPPFTLLQKGCEFVTLQLEAWANVSPYILTQVKLKRQATFEELKSHDEMFRYLYNLSNNPISYACLHVFIDDWLHWDSCPQKKLKETFKRTYLRRLMSNIGTQVKDMNLQSHVGQKMTFDDLKRLSDKVKPDF